jgi:hypothetical protein
MLANGRKVLRHLSTAARCRGWAAISFEIQFRPAWASNLTQEGGAGST